MYEVACYVDRGQRINNEDRALVGNSIIKEGRFTWKYEESLFVAICDGVGGEVFGEVAAEMTLDCMSEIARMQPDEHQISEQIIEANTRINDLVRQDNKYNGMSTTLVGASFNSSGVLVFNVGDSRLYRYRRPYIAQLTNDHSLAEMFNRLEIPIRAGLEHVITRYLGCDEVIPDFYNDQNIVLDGDVFLLCSDGISDVINDELMCELMGESNDVEVITSLLVSKAVEFGSQDNLSVIVIRVVE